MIRRRILRPVSSLRGVAGSGPTCSHSSDGTHVLQGVGSMKIDVRDNQIEPALKALKKLMLKNGLFQEMKRRAHYEKPSVKRKRKQALARKKLRKAMKWVALRNDELGREPPLLKSSLLSIGRSPPPS